MKTLVSTGLSVTALAVTLFTGSASAATYGPLVSPQELAADLAETRPIILDIRDDDYATGHIPGAVSAPYSQFRGPADNPGQLLDEDTYEQRFEALGLDPERPVVIVPEGRTDTDFGAAARVYWTLKSSGFTDLSILNGGLAGWRAAGNPLDTSIEKPEPTELDISFSKQWTAETAEVAAASRDEVDALLLDARPDDFFEGRTSHDAAYKPGTIPGAQNYVYTSFFNEDSAAMSAIPDSDALREQLGVEEDQEIVSFCNTGHWAATNWFALSEVAGIDNVKLYPGSVVEYSNAGLEMENTPGVFQNFLNRITGK